MEPQGESPSARMILRAEFPIRGDQETFGRPRVFAPLLVFVILLCALTAIRSPLDSHPDELFHVEAAAYYADNLLPPAVGDPRAAKSYSQYGYSYLNELDVVYVFAGKLGALLSPVAAEPYLVFRAFNLLLLTALLAVAVRFPPYRAIFLLLLVSPQVWYIFSYFNGDALPLFLSLLIAGQLVLPGSRLRAFLDEPRFRARIGGAILVGVLLGVLALSKRNYYVFLLFAASYLTYVVFGWRTAIAAIAFGLVAALAYAGVWSPVSTWFWVTAAVLGALTLFSAARACGSLGETFGKVSKLALIASIALAVFLPRYAYDRVVNGSESEKGAAIRQVAEARAKDNYKPSAMNDPGKAYIGLRLQSKGVAFHEIFLSPWNWAPLTFGSATGIYGYMVVRAPSSYYAAMALLYTGLFGYLAFRALARGGTEERMLTLYVFFFACLTIFQSAYHSWTNDLQPQGRYLFPVIAMFAVYLSRLEKLLRPAVLLPLVLGAFALSTMSFAYYAVYKPIPVGLQAHSGQPLPLY